MEAKVIGVAGNFRTGKDLFCDLFLKEQANEKAYKLSIGDTIKWDCAFFLTSYCKVENPFEPVNKEAIRPFWAWYSNYKRKQSNGSYFLDILKSKISYLSNHGVYTTFLIPDVRFKEFEYDEMDFVKENGILIFIDKYTIESGGTIIYSPPANQFEATNTPVLRQNCDYHLKWVDCEDNPQKIEKFCMPEVKKFSKWLENEYSQ